MNSLPDAQRVVFLLGPEAVELRRVPVPEPGPGEVLVRNCAATTCGTDVKVFRRGGHPRMLKVPCPFGHELAGTVAALGPPTGGSPSGSWKIGDPVVVANSAPCGECEYCAEGRENLCTRLEYLNGAFAEYILVPRRFVERSMHRMPEGLPFDLASLAEPLACVLHGLDACSLESPSDVAVYGAGPIGLLFVGALAATGHAVTVADVNPGRLAVALAMGAAKAVRIEPGGKQSRAVRAEARRPSGFDVAIDATGVPEAWADAIASVRPGGLANLFGGCAPGAMVPLDTHLVHYSELTIKGVYHHTPATFARAIALLARGALNARLLLSVERPLEELEEALRSMMRGDALKVAIRLGS